MQGTPKDPETGGEGGATEQRGPGTAQHRQREERGNADDRAALMARSVGIRHGAALPGQGVGVVDSMRMHSASAAALSAASERASITSCATLGSATW